MKRKLTIGMCCYDDAEGVWWTIQNIRLHHPEVVNEVEFLVIDNNAQSKHGKAVRDFLGWIKDAPVRCIGVEGARGTALRDYVFRLVDTPYVLCIDCHVMLAPGGLRRLIDGFDAGVDDGNLIQGPMLFDNLTGCASHMALEWRDSMWGVWAQAWRCTCGAVLQVRECAGRVDFQSIMAPHVSLPACRACGEEFPADITWAGHEHVLEQKGYVSAVVAGEPFEIPAHGLGLFACRKEAWLGFNPRMKGFGGEEGYLHEKYRRAGLKTLCVPALAWLHRFMRPHGVPYPMQTEERVWNYLVGHREVGLPIEPIIEHFRDKITHERMEALVQESESSRT